MSVHVSVFVCLQSAKKGEYFFTTEKSPRQHSPFCWLVLQSDKKGTKVVEPHLLYFAVFFIYVKRKFVEKISIVYCCVPI